MSKKLCLLVCSYLEQEVRAALATEDLKEVELASFPGGCDCVGDEKDIRENVPRAYLGDKENLKILGGGGCQRILRARDSLPKGSRVSPGSSCFEVLIGPDSVERYIGEGVHLLVPGMLRDWRKVAKGWGFDEKTVKEFFRESGSRWTLLDTGVGPSCEDSLRELSEFTGLPYEIVPVTLDYARLFLDRVRNKWKLEKNDAAKEKFNRRIAEYALVFELIERLAVTLDEKKIIDNAIELFSVLCAPKSVHYQACGGNDGEEGISRHNGDAISSAMRTALEKNVKPLEWIEKCKGFIVQIRHMDLEEGILTVENIAFPDHADDYLEMASTVAPVLALSVFNARTYKRLTEIEPVLEKRNSELIQEITVRKQAEDQIKISLKEKEVLVQEIHHRVKNNLQVISSMLSLQASTESNPDSVATLKESQRRIAVMARIHESLYRSENLASIKARDYLKNLVEDTKASVEKIDSKQVTVHFDVDDIILDADQAITYGQIISELLSNSLNHAFSNGQSGKITITLHQRNGEGTELTVTDNGKGLPEGFDIQESQTLGMRMVNALVLPLNGVVNIDCSDGTHIQITFPEKR